MVATIPVVAEVRIGGGLASVWRYARFAIEGSWKTMRRLVSSFHLILNPPFIPSYSVKADWMSLVLSSFGNPVRERMRVTEADSEVSDVDIMDQRVVLAGAEAKSVESCIV
jgi:hypothetical protein